MTKLKRGYLIADTSLINQREILEELNSFLAECTDDLHKFGIEFENSDLFEKLLIQILFHNSSLTNLSKGSEIEVRDESFKVNDISAAYSLTRLQIDTFVSLCYIFFLDIGYSKNLRAYVYKIHGLRKQICLTQKHPKDFEPVSKMRKELAQELKKIRKLEEFKNASFSVREKFINPKDDRLITLVEVYKSMQIGDLSRIRSLYSLYSNHIHSGYISIRQLIPAGNESEISCIFSEVLLKCSRMTSLVIANMNSQYELKEGSYSKAPSIMIKLVESLNELSAKL